MIPANFVHDLLGRTDIVEIVGRHVALRKAGTNHKGLCPFHAEKSPSFTVSPARQTYHCFGCGAHGNAVGFLMAHGGLGFVDAVHDLAQQTGMTVPDDESTAEDRARLASLKQTRSTLAEVLEKAADHYRQLLKSTPRAVEYLKGRGLSGTVAARFGLGYAADSWHGLASAFGSYDDPLLAESGLVIARESDSGEAGEARRYDRFRDRIMFPIRSVQGETVGFGGRILDRGEPKYLNSPETAVFSKGRELYGLFEARSAIRQRGYALVVEGYMDVVALAQAGFENAVATLGTACSEEHVKKLFRFTDTIVFSFDGDPAGRRAAGRALEASMSLATDTRSLRFLFLPEQDDPDSYVRQHGAEAFERCVSEAVPLSRQLIEQSREGCDIETAEGRARVLAVARPLWDALPDGALKRQLLPELAQAGALSLADLSDLWSIPARGSRAPSAAAPGNTASPAEPGFAASARPAPGRRGTQRIAPSTPSDHALRMLLLHSEWWDRLGHDDHELLHSLAPPHGSAFAWLERYLADHGPTPWAVIAQALDGESFAADVHARLPSAAFEDQMDFAELRSVLDGFWIDRLKLQQKMLIDASGTDSKALDRWREVQLELQARIARRRLAQS